mmetsp:Transcript_126011/g.402764  ORF Transcript_126011/g.402764 Transcript_126011/m.402764 type:complete len:136 (-) Transcript_126011:97-504(-)
MLAIASTLCVLLIMCVLKVQDASIPGRQYWGWLLVRGVLGGGRISAEIMAVLCGVKVGDVAALSSVNGLAGAILGYAMLGDNLSWVHLVAALLTMFGVALMTSPTFLVTNPSTMTLVGYVLALTAGCLQAFQFVA